MDWTEVILSIAVSDVETAEAVAAMTMPRGFYVEDYSDMIEMLPKIGCVDLIDEDLLAKDCGQARIHLYIPQNEDPAEAVAFIKERLAGEGIEYDFTTETAREEDWADNWKQYYKPVRIGKKLVICPSWEKYLPLSGDVIIELDPGSAFGTGQHETTRLCLEMLEDTVCAKDRVLDMGCGSGILSIAALKLGAAYVAAVDVDKNAADTACGNARNNGFGLGVYQPFSGNVISDCGLRERIGGEYDLIAANIVADVIIAMKEIFYTMLKSGKPLIVSGIIDTRTDEVVRELVSAGFQPDDRRELRGWDAVRFTKSRGN